MNISDINATIDTMPTIEKRPLFGPNDAPTPHFGLFRADNDQCLPITVKSGFENHTKDHLKMWTSAAVTALNDTDCAVTVNWSGNGHHIIVAPSKDYRRAIYGERDNIFPRAIIHAEYGRTIESEFGFYRDTCKNLMRVKAVHETTVKIRHSKSLNYRFDELVASFGNALVAFELQADIAQTLVARQSSVSDFIAQLYPVPDNAGAKALTQAKNRTIAIIQRLQNERHFVGNDETSLEVGNLWELLNAVTGYVQHDKTRHRNEDGSQIGRVDRALASLTDTETDNAWSLALSLAN